MKKLTPFDKILIAEATFHHVSHYDIMPPRPILSHNERTTSANKSSWT